MNCAFSVGRKIPKLHAVICIEAYRPFPDVSLNFNVGRFSGSACVMFTLWFATKTSHFSKYLKATPDRIRAGSMDLNRITLINGFLKWCVDCFLTTMMAPGASSYSEPPRSLEPPRRLWSLLRLKAPRGQ